MNAIERLRNAARNRQRELTVVTMTPTEAQALYDIADEARLMLERTDDGRFTSLVRDALETLDAEDRQRVST